MKREERLSSSFNDLVLYEAGVVAEPLACDLFHSLSFLSFTFFFPIFLFFPLFSFSFSHIPPKKRTEESPGKFNGNTFKQKRGQRRRLVPPISVTKTREAVPLRVMTVMTVMTVIF